MSGAISSLSQQQITSLLAAEQQQLSQPINNWKAQIQSDQTKLSAWGKVAGAMSSLNSAVNAISDPTSFDNRSATSSDTTVASASVQRGAASGSYRLTSVTLAQAQALYSQSYASGSTSLGSSSGALQFTFGSGQTETVNVTSANMNLAGVAQAINQVSGGQVKASLVGGTGGERLVLTGNQTGSGQSFSVSGTGALGQFQYASGSSANTMTVARSAQDATLNVNGVPVRSSTDTLANVLPSGSVTLTGSGSTTISVSVDATKLSQAVSSMVSKLDSAVSTLHKETALKTGSSSSGSSQTQAGPLLGNYAASDMANQLLSAVSGLSGSSLSGHAIGISVSQDGSVSFDSGAFASAYQSNPSGVEALVKQLYNKVHAITSTATNAANNGIVDAQKKSLNSDVKSLQSQMKQQNQFIQAQMQIYAQEYSQLVSTQSSLSMQSNYLSLFTNSSGSGSSQNG